MTRTDYRRGPPPWRCFSIILAVYSADFPRGMVSVSHFAPAQCFARMTICPVCVA